MGKGIYVGGHTKVMLSEEGTVWPTHVDDFGKLKETTPAPRKRWGDDALRDDGDEAGERSDWKRHIFRILAEYARAYRCGETPKPIEKVPGTLVTVIKQAGGVIDWIAADAARVRRFWKFVEGQDEQENRGPRVAVLVRKRSPSKPSFKPRRRPG